MFLGMGRYHKDLKIAAPYCICYGVWVHLMKQLYMLWCVRPPDEAAVYAVVCASTWCGKQLYSYMIWSVVSRAVETNYNNHRNYTGNFLHFTFNRLIWLL
jgi:hypothetical protein